MNIIKYGSVVSIITEEQGVKFYPIGTLSYILDGNSITIILSAGGEVVAVTNVSKLYIGGVLYTGNTDELNYALGLSAVQIVDPGIIKTLNGVSLFGAGAAVATNNAGQIRVDMTGITLSGSWTGGQAREFDLTAGTKTIYEAASYFPIGSAGQLSDIVDETNNLLKVNSKLKQYNLWRIQGSYSGKATGVAPQIIIDLYNPVSNFSSQQSVTLPETFTTGKFQVFISTISIADAIGDNRGYKLRAAYSLTDQAFILDVDTITRQSAATDIDVYITPST